MLPLARRLRRCGLPGPGREDRRAAGYGRRAAVQRRAQGTPNKAGISIGVVGVDWGVSFTLSAWESIPRLMLSNLLKQVRIVIVSMQ
jgi:hypothetical protein